MIPTSRFLALLAGAAVFSLGVFLRRDLLWAVWLVDGALAALALSDALTVPRKSLLNLTRKAANTLSLGRVHHFELRVASTARRRLVLDVAESFDPTFTVDGVPTRVRIPAGRAGTIAYDVTPTRRGAFAVGATVNRRTFVRAHSLLGLWRRQLIYDVPLQMRVYPDIRTLATYGLLARRNRIDMMGFRRRRGRAADIEFDCLRDYQPDDDFRRIDALASARQRKLITRHYQVSENQNIVFAIDCSRAMAGEHGGLSNLDHALNATLMLSHIALEGGDNVGVMAFDREIRTMLPAMRGSSSRQRVIDALYNVHVHDGDPDYELAFHTLATRVRQRSLIVLFTNLMDEASVSLVRSHLAILRRRHQPLVMLVRDADLFALAEQTPRNAREMFDVRAAAELATSREQVVKTFNSNGVLAVDVMPAQTTPMLINAYLRIKADNLL